MKQLAVIRDQDIYPDAPVVDASTFTHRRAARAVMQNDHGEIALLFVAARGYHKLPGGGIEDGEDEQMALDREIREETGCQMLVTGEVGTITEYRDQWEMVQSSSCYLAKQVGDQHQPSFTGDERAKGFKLVWAPTIAAAIALLKADHPEEYDGKRIRRRDLIFLRTAKELL